MSPLRFPLACLGLAAAAGLGGASPADARVTLLDGDRAMLERLTGAQPGGGAGIGSSDLAYEVGGPVVLGPSHAVARVTGAAPGLAGRSPVAMASLLRDLIAGSGAGAVIVDEIGPGFGASDAAALSEALDILAQERSPLAPSGLSRRVSLYATVTGATFTDPAASGVRAAMAKAGRVWLKASTGARPWTAAEWLTWPREAARIVVPGAGRRRLHVVFGAGDQAAAWRLARTGAACAVLGNGPGAYRLGASAADFVAEYRRAFPRPATGKDAPASCAPAGGASPALARSLEGLVAREATGLDIRPLLVPPPVAGEPAQLTVQLDGDALGLAGPLGVPTEEMWTAAQARLRVSAPGAVVDVPVDGDGAARVAFTPTAAGPVTMSLVVPAGGVVRRASGAELDLVAGLRAVGAARSVIDRVVGDPEGWGVALPVQPAGSAPGGPVLQVIAAP